MFKEGHKKIGGRKKGSTNLLTRTVKEVVLETFNHLQEDDEASYSLKKFAKSNPKDFYNIAAKLIPTEMAVKAEVTNIEISKTIISKANK